MQVIYSFCLLTHNKSYQSILKVEKRNMKYNKISEDQNFSDFSNMYTPARFKILKELQDLKSLLQNLTCSCSDSYSREDSELLTIFHFLENP